MLRLWHSNNADVIFSIFLSIKVEDVQVYYKCKLCCPSDIADS